MSEAFVLRHDSADGVATLVLNRPGKRNALSARMVAQLSQHLHDVGEDPGVRVIALRGAGQDFCAGADLAELAASRSRGPEDGLADAARLGEVFVRIRRLGRPVVAVVTGRALGGGCGLATACDLVLAREDAVFGYPEVHLGFVPALVMSILRRKLGESAALELLLLGDRIGAVQGSVHRACQPCDRGGRVRGCRHGVPLGAGQPSSDGAGAHEAALLRS